MSLRPRRLSKKKKEWWIGGFVPSATTQTVLDLLDSDPPLAFKQAMNTFINSQASAEGGSGNWELMNEFIMYGMDTEANSLIGWRGVATAINVSSAPHVPWSGAGHLGFAGFEPDGAASYINTSIPPDNLGQDDCIGGVWLFTEDASGGILFGVQSLSANTRYQLLESGASVFYRVNSSASASLTASFPNNSLLSIARSASNSQEYIVNATQTDIEADGSVDISTLNIADGAFNNDGAATSFFDGKLTMRYFATNTGFDRTNFFDNLLIFLQELVIES